MLADDGVEFLQQAATEEKPFFMYLTFNAAHDPRQAPKEYIDRYPLTRIKLPEYPHAGAVCGKDLRDERLMTYPRTEYAVKVNRQDVMPNSLEIAGTKPAGVDFKSLLSLLRGESNEHYDAIYGGYLNRQRMVTKGDWKLITYPTIGTERLFNVKKDPDEMHELTGNPEFTPQLNEMRAALSKLGIELNDPLAAPDE